MTKPETLLCLILVLPMTALSLVTVVIPQFPRSQASSTRSQLVRTSPSLSRQGQSSNNPSASVGQVWLGMTSDFGSDFGSAMPEKPQLSLGEKMIESADQFIESMESALGEGVDAPPELDALKEARKNKASPEKLALRVYELMIERGMLYDEAPETGTLTPTEFNIQDNLDVPEVKDEFGHLYKYGMRLMNLGLLTGDEVKETVMKRLIQRTGLEPEEFDKWLGY